MCSTAGQLGTGDTTSHTSPTPVSGGHKFLQIEAAYWHTCGVRLDSRVLCWGDNSMGERILFEGIMGEGGGFVLFLRSLSNAGFAGQLGTGDYSARLTPTQISGGGLYVQVAAMKFATCTSGTITKCFGDNTNGALGEYSADATTNLPAQRSNCKNNNKNKMIILIIAIQLRL